MARTCLLMGRENGMRATFRHSVRRYPFVMADGGANGRLVVCMDESCPALNAKHGELLINAEGKLEPRMNEVMQFLQNFQRDSCAPKPLPGNLMSSGCSCNGARASILRR